MILSVSRRTDIPNYYFEWFVNRLKEGFVYVRNPMNVHQISKIDLSPQLVDCIVFWTKNPLPMLDKINDLQSYSYYFQFTLTGYGKDIEPNLPDKFLKTSINIFLLSGKLRCRWRSCRYIPGKCHWRHHRTPLLQTGKTVHCAGASNPPADSCSM